jgi:hypothetical protein
VNFIHSILIPNRHPLVPRNCSPYRP